MKKVTKIESVQNAKTVKQKLRIAAYCRVSTGSDAQLESLDVQKSHYERYITSRDDWQFAGLYYDEGITGTKTEKRPELLRLIADCEAKKIDLVITKSISRFSRNTTDCLELVRKLLSLNIPLFFEKENINTGSMESELFLAILSSMAEGESASISENAKWSIKRRFQNGTFKLSYAPYGYDWDGTNLTVNPEQAKTVKRIFSDVLSGKGTNTIADALNAEAVPSKKNGRWTSSSVRGILANEKYTGDVIFQKTYTDDNFNRHKNHGEVDQYMMANHHEAIISHEDFEAANALIDQRALEKGIQKGNDKYQQRYAFSSKIICSECGNTFKRRIHSCATYKYVAWTCNTHIDDKNACSMKYIYDEELKAAFITMMNKLIYSHKFLLKPYLKVLENSSGEEAVQRIQHLERLLEQNSEQRETLTKLMAQGYIDQILYNQEMNALLLQADSYRSDIETITTSMTGDAAKVTETAMLLQFVSHSEMLTEYSEELFEEFADHIEVQSRNEVRFILKCGLTFTERMGD